MNQELRGIIREHVEAAVVQNLLFKKQFDDWWADLSDDEKDLAQSFFLQFCLFLVNLKTFSEATGRPQSEMLAPLMDCCATLYSKPSDVAPEKDEERLEIDQWVSENPEGGLFEAMEWFSAKKGWSAGQKHEARVAVIKAQLEFYTRLNRAFPLVLEIYAKMRSRVSNNSPGK